MAYEKLFLHDELIFTKNADGFANWQEDVISFMQYTYSLKAEWDPQYTSIIKNQETVYPKIAYTNKADSIKLERAIYLAKNCGSGFSFKKGYWKSSFFEPNCNDSITYIFNELRTKQIKENPINFYLKVPLENLKKSIFKSKLYNQESVARKYASFLFIWRTLLIIFGILGSILILKDRNFHMGLIFILFFISIYFTLSFGTSPFMRNIEVRYFLPADIILILPASFSLMKIST